MKLHRPGACLALLLLVAAARAQEPLFVSPIFEAGEQPRHLSSGDMNGDGLPDLVETRNNNALSVLLNVGGTFGPPSTVAVSNLSRRTALADYDGDGDLDVALALDAPALEVVNLYRGVGDGSLLPPLFSLTADGPYDIEAADLDADGDADLAVACPAGARVSLLLGDGDATFAPHTDVVLGGSVRGLAIGRLDGDADLDIAVAGSNDGLRTLLGNGAGGFSIKPGAVSTGQPWADVDLGDVDTDGDADALLAGDATQAAVALGAGDGSFGATTLIGAPGTTLRPELADVDEDGDADAVFMASFPDASLDVSLSAGDGSFGAVARFAAMGQIADFAVDDFNEDGDVDLVAVGGAAFAPSRGVVFAGHGDGSFGPQYKLNDGTRELDVADVDGDGHLDVSAAGVFFVGFSTLRGLDFGAFASPPVDTSVAGFTVVDVALGDVVEDGLADAVLLLTPTSVPPSQVSVYAADASPALFGGGGSFPLPSQPQHHALADLDADGHLDLVVTLQDSTVRSLRGDGAGGFSAADVQSSATSGRGVAIGDLDADGLPDLVTGTTLSLTHVYLGHGDAFFDAPLTFATSNANQASIALGDMDGDEDLDVVLGSDTGTTVSLLFNDGFGFLSGLVGLNGVLNPYGVAIADVTHDGLPDVVSAGGNTSPPVQIGEIVVWEGLWRGAIAGAQIFPMTTIPKGLVVRDFDGDGWLDVAVASQNDDLSVRLNQRGPWGDLGHPLAGALGLPRQRGLGTLLGGEPFEFRMTDALPGGLTGHVIGLSTIDAPFKGGVFVPEPLLINYPLPLDAQGDLTLAGNWPGPSASGVNLYFQFWTADPAGVKGFSASNALRATLP